VKLAGLRFRVMGRFERQVFIDVLVHIALATLSGIALFVAIDTLETGNLSSANAKASDLFMLQIARLPVTIQQVIGITSVAGGMTAVTQLMRKGEIIAVFSGGAGPAIILKPALLAGLAVALLYAAMTDWVVPSARAQVSQLRSRLGLPTGDSGLGGPQRWLRNQDRIFRVEDIRDTEGGSLGSVLMFQIQNGRLLERWDLKGLEFLRGDWIGQGVVHRRFPAGEGLHTERFDSQAIAIQESPEDFLRSVGQPERLTYRALRASTLARERLGQSSTQHRLELDRRHAFPLMLLLVVMASAGMALRLGRKPPVSKALAVASLMGFGVFLLEELNQVVAQKGALPPWITAHVGAVLAGGLAASAWLRVYRQGIQE
jgi:LPS export ABC transporter permease LptG